MTRVAPRLVLTAVFGRVAKPKVILSSELLGSDPNELLGLSGPSEPSLGVRQQYPLSFYQVPNKVTLTWKQAHLEKAKVAEEIRENMGGGGGGGEEQGQKGPVTAKGYHPRGSLGRGKGSRGRQNIGRKQSAIPVLCVSIIIPDSTYKLLEEFCLLRDPGPHLPEK